MPNQRFFPGISQHICIALALFGLCQRADAATACVWRVTNVPVPFYLVGTVHALAGSDYPLPKAYDLDAELILLDTLVRGDRRRDDNDKMRAGWKHGDVTPISVEEERIRNQNLGAS